MKLLNGASFQRLETALHAAETRQRVISNNIANAETPNFKRSELLFEQLLEQSMNNGSLAGRRTYERHMAIGASASRLPDPQVKTDHSTMMSNFRNNVDMDREQALLAKNQLSYNYYIGRINHDIKMIRTAIEGRG